MKHLKKDNKGLAVLIMAIIIVVLLVAVGVMAYVYVGEVQKHTDDAPDQDHDGDGVEDPIIGYLDLYTRITADNRQYIGDIITWQIQETRCTLADSPGTMKIIDELGYLDQTKNIRVEFVVTQNAYGLDWTTSVNREVTVHGTVMEEFEFSPTDTLGIRYHGTYHIAVTMYDNGSGAAIVSGAINVEL